MSETEEYQQAITDLNETYRSGIRSFAKWFSKEFSTSREQWMRECADTPPSDDWFVGYNAGVEAILMGVDLFLEEWHQW